MVTKVRSAEEIAQMVGVAYFHALDKLETTRANILSVLQETEELTGMSTDLGAGDKITLNQATEDVCWKNAIKIFVESLIDTEFDPEIFGAINLSGMDTEGLRREGERINDIDTEEILLKIVSDEKNKAMKASIRDFNQQNSAYKLSDISQDAIEKFFTSFLKKHQLPLSNFIREKLISVRDTYVLSIKQELVIALQDELQNKKQSLKMEQEEGNGVTQELIATIEAIDGSIRGQAKTLAKDTNVESVQLVIRELQDLIDRKRTLEELLQETQKKYEKSVNSIKQEIQTIVNQIDSLENELGDSIPSEEIEEIPFGDTQPQDIHGEESVSESQEGFFERSFRQYNPQNLSFVGQNNGESISVKLLGGNDVILVNGKEIPVQGDKYFTVPGGDGRTIFLVLGKNVQSEKETSKRYNLWEWNERESIWEESNSMDVIGEKFLFLDEEGNYIISGKKKISWFNALPFKSVSVTQDKEKNDKVIDGVLYLTRDDFIGFINGNSHP